MYSHSPDLHWYLEKKFEWTISSAEKFYRITHRRFRSWFYENFKNLDDFDDVFQNSMLKFAISLQNNKFHFRDIAHAFYTFKKIFKNTMIDFFRRDLTLRNNQSRYEKYLDSDNDLITVDSNEPNIENLFSQVDKKIDDQPRLMSKRQLEFYKAFKSALSTYDSDEEIRINVMVTMDINEGYYGKLKTEVIKILKSLNNDSF